MLLKQCVAFGRTDSLRECGRVFCWLNSVILSFGKGRCVVPQAKLRSTQERTNGLAVLQRADETARGVGENDLVQKRLTRGSVTEEGEPSLYCQAKVKSEGGGKEGLLSRAMNERRAKKKGEEG